MVPHRAIRLRDARRGRGLPASRGLRTSHHQPASLGRPTRSRWLVVTRACTDDPAWSRGCWRSASLALVGAGSSCGGNHMRRIANNAMNVSTTPMSVQQRHLRCAHYTQHPAATGANRAIYHASDEPPAAAARACALEPTRRGRRGPVGSVLASLPYGLLYHGADG